MVAPVLRNVVLLTGVCPSGVCVTNLEDYFYNNHVPLLGRLAEKYKESLANKEKILKEIEVKKEYLSNLQPRLNSIMQVCPLSDSPLRYYAVNSGWGIA